MLGKLAKGVAVGRESICPIPCRWIQMHRFKKKMHHFLNMVKYLSGQWAWMPFMILKKKGVDVFNGVSSLLPSGRWRCWLCRLRSPLWSQLWCISAMELYCQWPHCLGCTRQCLDPTAIEYCTDSHLRRESGRPVQQRKGRPDTSPESRPRLQRGGPAHSLPEAPRGSKTEKTTALASSSSAPHPKDASFPCSLCYCVSSLPSFFFILLIQLEWHDNRLSKGKWLGWREGRWYDLIHHGFLLISRKRLCLANAKVQMTL